MFWGTRFHLAEISSDLVAGGDAMARPRADEKAREGSNPADGFVRTIGAVRP
jgi:hypothetical protein